LKEESLSDTTHEDAPKVDVLGKAISGPHYKLEIGNDEIFQNRLQKAYEEGKLNAYTPETTSSWTDLLPFLPIVIFIAIWIYMMRRMWGDGGGGGGQIVCIGRSRAKVFDAKTDIKVTFRKVAGLEGAREEVQEIVDFLKKPEKYTSRGGKIPKG